MVFGIAARFGHHNHSYYVPYVALHSDASKYKFDRWISNSVWMERQLLHVCSTYVVDCDASYVCHFLSLNEYYQTLPIWLLLYATEITSSLDSTFNFKRISNWNTSATPNHVFIKSLCKWAIWNHRLFFFLFLFHRLPIPL